MTTRSSSCSLLMRWVAPTGTSRALPTVTTCSRPSTSQVAVPLTTVQCSDRWACVCSESRWCARTSMRLTLNPSPSSRTVQDPQGRSSWAALIVTSSVVVVTPSVAHIAARSAQNAPLGGGLVDAVLVAGDRERVDEEGALTVVGQVELLEVERRHRHVGHQRVQGPYVARLV